MFHRFLFFIASLFVLSCSTNSKEIEVVYEIKKMNDWNFDVSLSILNSTNFDFDSVWNIEVVETPTPVCIRLLNSFLKMLITYIILKYI